jgi:hypothetical protein
MRRDGGRAFTLDAGAFFAAVFGGELGAVPAGFLVLRRNGVDILLNPTSACSSSKNTGGLGTHRKLN